MKSTFATAHKYNDEGEKGNTANNGGGNGGGIFFFVAGVGGGGFVVAGSGGTSARLIPFEGVWLRSLE